MLSSLMHDWIVGHVLTHDMKLKHFFEIAAPGGLDFLPPDAVKESILQSTAA
jgi:hypothetical protein